MELLHTDRCGAVATLTLGRPAQRNALNMALMVALQDSLDALETDRDIRVILLKGAGPAFCAGHDLKELRDNPDPGFRREALARCARLMLTLTRLPQPVIACVHGIATAAGCQLVASCDLAIASETARFATPGVHIGLFCSTPMVALTRVVGTRAAMEMLLLGEPVPADKAERIGLVNRVVPGDQLGAAAQEMADRIAAKSPLVIRTGKRAFFRQREMSLEEAYRHTSEVMAENLGTADAGEGISAFLERRTPAWTGN